MKESALKGIIIGHIYIRIMEKKMETTIVYKGIIIGCIYIYIWYHPH